jgi:quercetin dioxygenase-like cupin family protein
MAKESTKEEYGVCRILLDNDRVTVYEFCLGPRQKAAMHTHPEYVAYLLTEAKLSIKYDSGIQEDRGYKAGEAGYRKAQAHEIQNMGDEEVKIIITEIKK